MSNGTNGNEESEVREVHFDNGNSLRVLAIARIKSALKVLDETIEGGTPGRVINTPGGGCSY